MYSGGVEHRSRARQRWIRISALLLTGRVALGKSLHLVGLGILGILTRETEMHELAEPGPESRDPDPALALPTDGPLALSRAQDRAFQGLRHLKVRKRLSRGREQQRG